MYNTVSKPNIPLSEPHISGNEWTYVKECLDTGWVSSVGKYVDKFESIVRDYVGCKHAVAIVNGTSALHISLVACGITAGDEVIVPTLTFIAPVNVVKYCNAHPVFADCHKDTLCMDINKVVDFVEKDCEQRGDGYTYNNITGRRVMAIIPVHIFGHPVDLDPLVELCNEKNIIIIEDATESLGSEYKGRKTGSFGTVGCFSFNGNKIITTGGGGMIVSNDEKLASRIRHLTTQAKKDPFEYDHDEIGYNYRLTNLQAAMGVAQMEKLDKFIEIKRRNSLLYRKLLSDLKPHAEFLWEEPYAKSNFWFYSIKVPKEHKTSLMKYLLSKQIQVRPVWKLIHSLPMYKDCIVYNIENATECYERYINIPCSVNLVREDIEYIVENIRNYFGGL